MRTSLALSLLVGSLGLLAPGCTAPPEGTAATSMEVGVAEGEGTVAIEGESSACPPTCSAVRDLAEPVTWSVTATPAEGWELVEWRTDLASTSLCPADGSTLATFTEVVTEPSDYRCLAVFRRTGDPDPEDLSLDPNGDASVDVVHVDSWRTPDDGVVVCTEMAGAWPPDDTIYSWYVSTILYSSTGAELVSATLQRHDGTRSTSVTGVPESSVQFVERADGVCIYVAGSIDAERLSCESGTQLTTTGTRVTDEVPDGGDLAIGTRVAPPPGP